MTISDQTIRATAIKRRYEKKWLEITGVTAVGIGLVNNRIGIIISVEGNVNKVRTKIPQMIEGVPTLVQRTGTLKAQHD